MPRAPTIPLVDELTLRAEEVGTCPHCNSFPLEGLHLVGRMGKKHTSLVVRSLWREIRLEATEQAFSRTNR